MHSPEPLALILNKPAQQQKAGVLSRTERIGHARVWPPAEAVRLVMISSAKSVETADNAIIRALLVRVHRISPKNRSSDIMHNDKDADPALTGKTG
jgi:hypothetical protein